jgi:hypothetical protein
MIPITARATTSGVAHFDASGNSVEAVAQEAEGAHLVEHADQQRAGARPVDSAAASGSQVWNGTSGALIAKAMKKPSEQPLLQLRVDLQVRERGEVERAGAGEVLRGDVQPDERRQHEQAAEQRVQQELDRGVVATRAAVAPDEEVHRDEHRLEEHVEQEHVGGGEDADHRGLEHEDQRDVGLDGATGAVGVVPAGEEHDGHEARRERDQHQRDAVDTHREVDAERRDPVVGEPELEVGGVRDAEPGGRDHGDREDDERGRETDLLGQLVRTLGQQHHDHRCDQRGHEEQEEPGEGHG